MATLQSPLDKSWGVVSCCGRLENQKCRCRLLEDVTGMSRHNHESWSCGGNT
jgi:hypothetical protein